MKKLSVTDASLCAACRSCEIACSQAYYKKYDPELSCIQIGTKKDGKTTKVNVCIQCGKCMKACENGAITQNEKTGVYMINKKLCVGCGKCKEVCPSQVICKAEDKDNVTKCIACGICVKACPMGILEIVEK